MEVQMKNILIVVDMQVDFISGALGTPEARAIVENAVQKIRAFQGNILVTFDTHHENYLETAEGKKLPVPHCIRKTEGWQLDERIAKALDGKSWQAVEKPSFGSTRLPGMVQEIAGNDHDLSIELIGLCTDICVVSNAMILKAHFPEAAIKVDSACCAGVTPETHRAALATMACCQIEIQ